MLCLASTDSVYDCEGKWLEKFLSLPEEKQNTIIDAALSAFAANGYKKTSVSDIASAAGISKAMIFHYFGTKKALYLYLIGLCGDILIEEINSKFDSSVTDFFDRIMQATTIKIAAMKKHTAIPLFLESAFFENDPEVKEDIQLSFSSGKSESFRARIVLEGMDASKFKDGIDPKLVMNLLVCLGYGFTNMLKSGAELNYDALCKEFGDYLRLLKANFYREECL